MALKRPERTFYDIMDRNGRLYKTAWMPTWAAWMRYVEALEDELSKHPQHDFVAEVKSMVEANINNGAAELVDDDRLTEIYEALCKQNAAPEVIKEIMYIAGLPRLIPPSVVCYAEKHAPVIFAEMTRLPPERFEVITPALDAGMRALRSPF